MKKFYLLLAGIPAFCPAQAQSTAKEEVLLISHQAGLPSGHDRYGPGK
jgi:hypothetical protein